MKEKASPVMRGAILKRVAASFKASAAGSGADGLHPRILVDVSEELREHC